MNEHDFTQLELFSQSKDPRPQERRNNPFFAFVWTYEKTILLVIALVAVGVVSFSLGVEKGKRMALLRSDSRFDTASNKPRSQPAAAPAVPKAAPASGQTVVPGELSGSYTIQLASFNTRSYAQKEMDKLKRKGYSALIMHKGKFIVLCVGSFPSKENAQILLAELRKSYKTCYVRRL